MPKAFEGSKDSEQMMLPVAAINKHVFFFCLQLDMQTPNLGIGLFPLSTFVDMFARAKVVEVEKSLVLRC